MEGRICLFMLCKQSVLNNIAILQIVYVSTRYKPEKVWIIRANFYVRIACWDEKYHDS